MSAWGTWPPSPSNVSLGALYLQNPGSISLSVPPAALGLPVGATDAEFDSDPNWTYYEWAPTPGVRVPSGVPNWGARINGPPGVPAISFTQRKSYAVVQTPNSVATEAFYYNPNVQTWAANTSKWYWVGGANWYDYRNDYRKGFGIFNVSGGFPDRQNQTYIGDTDQGGGHFPLCAVQYNASTPGIVGGGGTPAAGTAAQSGMYWPYAGIFMNRAATRPGVTLEYWVFNDQGQRQCLGVSGWSALGATYYVGFYIRQVSISSAGGATGENIQNSIFHCDFFRETIGDTPPWIR